MASKLHTVNVPLHCNICPKKPDFSDVSHLLTHIASKSHLSTYYKLKIKASSDHASQQLVNGYDAWYTEWGIEVLMSERLKLKENRHSRSANGGNHTPVPAVQYTGVPAYHHAQSFEQHDYHTIDPRLEPVIKQESFSSSNTPDELLYQDHLGYPLHHPAYTNHHIAWHPTTAQGYMIPNPDIEDDASEGGVDPFLPHNHAADNVSLPGLGAEADDTVNDLSKLKGVFWPGMNMFDAAPPEQRRRRNQKKDTSVVKWLEAMSLIVEPTEVIYSSSGTYRTSRTITGLPNSDENPLSGEESSPGAKKAKRVATAPRRKPLAEKNVNASRKPTTAPLKRGRPTKATAAAKAKINASAKVDNGHTPDVKQRKRRNNATVHRDREVTFDDPANMDTLNSGFVAPPAAAFRPMEPTYVPHQSYFSYQNGYMVNPFYVDPSGITGWDMYAHDAEGTMINPFYLHPNYENTEIDDDQQTISVPGSEQ